MIKTYSTLTGKYYPTAKEAEEAEKKFTAEKEAAEKAKNEVTAKVAAIKKQRDDEIKACNSEISDVTAKIEELIKKRNSLRTDIDHINDEANHELAKYEYDGAISTCDDEKSECSIKVKTYDSSKDKDWNTIIDEKGTVADVLKKLRGNLNRSDMKTLLSMFDI